jgi:hypothetical protein
MVLVLYGRIAYSFGHRYIDICAGNGRGIAPPEIARVPDHSVDVYHVHALRLQFDSTQGVSICVAVAAVLSLHFDRLPSKVEQKCVTVSWDELILKIKKKNFF